DIWTKFSLPARRIAKNPNRYEIIPNYLSCNKCFQTYRFLDSNTSSMRDHRCPKDISSTQMQLKSFVTSSPTASSSSSPSLSGMRPFQIISDSGLQAILQECLDIGLYWENIRVEEILSCDRTIRNELSKQAEIERNQLRQLILDCAKSGRLCISPDIWTDNYRKISYLGATAHMVDEKFGCHSIDLFCIEFKDKKNPANILKVKEKKTPSKSSPIISTEITPMKTTNVGRQPSPELISSDEQTDDEEKAALEGWDQEEDDDDADTIDYSILDLSSIPWNAQEILETIKYCKVLVKYVKKSTLNRQIQLFDVELDRNEEQHLRFTTIYQFSLIRWLSMCNLLQSIKRSYEPLRILLLEIKQLHRLEKINIVIVDQLIDFLQPWQNILKEVQRGNGPSLHVVFPCINYLQEDLRKRERSDKSGKI
ncbi:unnamed protein product, partial [Rotaria sp. Silwood1]